jgi:hypothetical protein
LQGGKTVPLEPADAFLLQKVPPEDDTWRLVSSKKKSWAKHWQTRLEAVYNGACGKWQHIEKLNDLTYLPTSQRRSLLYLGFEPDACSNRPLLPKSPECNSYLLKIGFHNVRSHCVTTDMMRYIWKKPLMWFLEGRPVLEHGAIRMISRDDRFAKLWKHTNKQTNKQSLSGPRFGARMQERCYFHSLGC